MSYCYILFIQRIRSWKLSKEWPCPRNQLHFFTPNQLVEAWLSKRQGSRNFSDVWLAHWSGSGGSSDGISVYAPGRFDVFSADPRHSELFHNVSHFTSFNDSQCLLRASRRTVEVTGLVYSTTRVLVGQRGSTTRHSTKTLRIPSTCWMCKLMLKRFHPFFKRPFLPTMNH